MIRKSGYIIVLAVLLAPLSALAGAVDDEYESLRAAYQKLKGDPARRKFRTHWSKISVRLVEIADAGEGSAVAPRALFTAAELFRDLRRITLSAHDLDDAVALYGRVAAEYPQSLLADDALYWKALLLKDVKNDQPASCETLRVLLEKHAAGDMAPKARKLAEGCPAAGDSRPATHDSRPATGDRQPTTDNRQPATDANPRSEIPNPKSEAAAGVPHAASGIQPPASVVVKEITCRAGEKGAFVTISLSGPAKFRYDEMKAEPAGGKPPRIFLDVQDATLPAEVPKTIPVDKGFVKQVRAGQHKDGLVRVVLDLESLERFSIAAFDRPDRIVMKFGEVRDETPPAAPPPAPPPLLSPSPPISSQLSPQPVASGSAESGNPKSQIPNPKSSEPPPPMIVSMKEGLKAKIKNGNAGAGIPLSEQLGLKFRRIVIDPGHGGEDNGAIGRKKTAEKDVALAVAKKLASRLKERLKIDVIMTRTGDQTVPLSERAALARAVKADLFVSIHANANPNRKFRGIETYYLNNTDDRAAQKVAAVENAVSDKTLSDLKMTLLDLALSANVEDSIRLANLIQKNTVDTVGAKFSDIKDHGVKYALFYVLFGTEVPSVLVETSFISNPVEEQR
ncbi:MAG: N-acetylmuramoyl-L-alanine amidase, partial [Deltaproteobacteria bacterium]|nr:N-acetylmuramoyl-L-alanine amidase [Deltaproteobacteria bacterium]